MAGLSFAPMAGAQQAEEPSAIVVTGARGKPRTVIDSPTPVDVITAEDLNKAGRAGVLQAMSTLVPSINVPNRAGGGTSAVISTFGLRGLNPDQALVLVNGKRRHKTALINSVSSLYNGSVPTDLDMIPTSAIERIEVLRDGAAAQYGSDAIAGVINIVLKKSTGGSASLSYGQNFDRHDGDLARFEANWGTKIGHDGGFLNLSVSAKHQANADRSDPIAFPTSLNDITRLYYPVNGAFDPREYTADRKVTNNFGVMPSKSINSGYNLEIPAGDVTLYSFGTLSYRDTELTWSFRQPDNANSLPQVYPNGFRPVNNILETDFDVAAGARGTTGGWDWDLGATIGRNLAEYNSRDNINASLGPTSPTRFHIGDLRSGEITSSLDLSRGFDLGGANLQLSGGLQYRHEIYQIRAGDPASYATGTYTYVVNGATITPAPGAQSTPGFQPGEAGRWTRDNVAAYIDLGLDVTPQWFVDVAGRVEHYSGSSGDTAIGKITSRYELTPTLAIRGAVSTGFRAPALAQQHYASTTSQRRNDANGRPTIYEVKTLPVDSAAAIALGAVPLKPEKSTNFSAGLAFNPAPGVSVTLDAYQIDIDDRIAITDILVGGVGTTVGNILVNAGLSPLLSAQYYTNAIDTRTRGIDLVATYRLGLGDYGAINWSLAANYNKTTIRDIKTTALQSFGRVVRGNLTEATPKTKIIVSADYELDRFSLLARLTRYGGYKSISTTAVGDRSFGSEYVADLELGYKLTDALQISIGSANIFNNYPDETNNISAEFGSGRYSTLSPFGITGGTYYARISATF